MSNEFLKKNLLAKEKIENDVDYPQKLRDVKPVLLGSLFRTFGGGCVNCGAYVSERVLSFYQYDVTSVLCFDCQNETAEVVGRMRRDDDEKQTNQNTIISDYLIK